MRRHPAQLIEILRAVFGERITHLIEDFSEVTLVIGKSDYLDVMKTLTGSQQLQFAELIDLCGMDYAGYNNDPNGLKGKRFAVVSHLLSLEFNCRLRVRVFAEV